VNAREQDAVAVVVSVSAEQRDRIDAAIGDTCRPLHVGTIPEVRAIIRRRPVRALLVSSERLDPQEFPAVARLVREFPGVPTAALWSGRPHPGLPERLLGLGATGVQRLIDLNERDGWSRLRVLVGDDVQRITARILDRLAPAIGPDAASAVRFFALLARLAPSTPTVRCLTRRLRVRGSTFMSRFFRAGLPSPKRYLAAMRLNYAAALFESPGLSVADVAYRLEYSSPQSFGRHLRTGIGLTASEFRRRCPFDLLIRDYADRLLVPYRASLRTFRPL